MGCRSESGGRVLGGEDRSLQVSLSASMSRCGAKKARLEEGVVPIPATGGRAVTVFHILVYHSPSVFDTLKEAFMH